MGGSTFIGRVVSNRMQKTVVVAVNYVIWVPKYKVYEKRVARHMAHDAEQECVVGDLVKIQASRKYTNNKSYRVSDILRRTPLMSEAAAAAAAAAVEPGATAATTGAVRGGGGERGVVVAGAVDAAEQRLAAAQERLAAVRRLYKQELGALRGGEQEAEGQGGQGVLGTGVGNDSTGAARAGVQESVAGSAAVPLQEQPERLPGNT